MNELHYDDTNAIAIVGMAGRFPGAADLERFWQNLKAGVESIHFMDDAELRQAGVSEERLKDPHYVKAAPLLDDIERFDASFFGYSPGEAIALDPQQRLFLECAWEALEQAGYNPENYPGAVGLYGGIGINTYMLYSRHYPDLSGDFLTSLAGCSPDFLATRVSYKLNLKGPSVTVQTACSTALVAVHMACQSLLSGESDMALAGAVSLWILPKSGYTYQEGGIVSPDGHCRAFDAEASGTLFGNGVGLVVLKRLEEALTDGDHIHAVIRASAINNDGGGKVGYTATSVEGQAQVIGEALALSGVDPETIGYVEAHGTGTALGDPIEVAGLTRAFRAGTTRRGYCALGSVKTNIGHMGVASGIAGLLKAVLSVEAGIVPPSLHFQNPNPQIDFAASPFFVNTEARPWPVTGTPRRAGVSSLGIGGTNAHAILEEAPAPLPTSPARNGQLLVLSARSPAALDRARAALAAYLETHPNADLADMSYTLQVGRKAFDYRWAGVVQDHGQARSQLQEAIEARRAAVRPVSFLFSGQGAQHLQMAAGLYRDEPVFRDLIDQQAALLKPWLGLDLRQLLYPLPGQEDAARTRLTQTRFAQPALFAVEYALARLWQGWGIEPVALLGHSLGEYVAACVAGIFSLTDALALVAVRGRLMQQLPPGRMLAIRLPLTEIEALLDDELALAAHNGPLRAVVSGSPERIEKLQADLVARGVECRLLHTSHAFHSQAVVGVVELFRQQLRTVVLKPPQIPLLSNLTGTWLTAAEATDPEYWICHLRQPVRFAEGLAHLSELPENILLEVGPGSTLATLAQEHPALADHSILSSLPHPRSEENDRLHLLTSLGQLWRAGVSIDWQHFYGQERRHRLALPTYPFERQRYWLEPLAPPVPTETALHPLIERRQHSPRQTGEQFVARLSTAWLPYLADHRVHELTILPGAAFLEAATAAARLSFPDQAVQLEAVAIEEPLVLSESETRDFHLLLERREARMTDFEIHSREEGASSDLPWIRHASGTIRSGLFLKKEPLRPPAPIREGLPEVEVQAFYRALTAKGLAHGPAFQGIVRLWRSADEALAQLQLPASLSATGNYAIHPALLDSFLQVSLATLPESDTDIYLPLAFEQVRLIGPLPASLWAHARRRAGADDGETFLIDLDLLGEEGEVAAQVRGLLAKRAPLAALGQGQSQWRNWLYGIEWQPQPLPQENTIQPGGDWLVVAAGTSGAAIVDALEQRGQTATLLLPNAPDLARQIAGRTGILYLASDTKDELESAWQQNCAPLLPLVRGCVQIAGSDVPPRLYLVTQGAQVIESQENPVLEHIPLWGLGRVIAQEHPELWGGLIDLDPAFDPEAAATALVTQLFSPDDEDQIALRGDARYVARLVRQKVEGGESLSVRADGTYLITGGLGALGLQVARYLVERGARHLVLVGRNPPSVTAQTVLDELTASGATVSPVQADVSIAGEVEQLLAEIRQEHPPIVGILHAAGVLDDGVIDKLDWSRFERVLAAKAAGAWHLHRLTQGDPLELFVLFSSIASLLGSPGQANYAAANAFLDGLAQHRLSQALPALSINWGPWAEVGMAARLDAQRHPWLSQGLETIPPEQALAALAGLTGTGTASLAVMPVRWQAFLAQFPAGHLPPLLRTVSAASSPAAGPVLNLTQQLEQALPGERRSLLVAHLRDQAARVLGIAEGDNLDIRQPLHSLGLDSLLALNLTRQLGAALGRSLSATLLFNYPTVEGLAAHLAEEVLGLGEPEASAAPASEDGLDRLAAQLQTLSESELEALLLEKLEGL
ncbi:type I polyketide synthase [Gloeobacter kilaueensis]|uniref:Beta-ketoacyl synthase n=1 Tax=Gloeobacter kilaueensis (strain ATCC BAA-2537 / CCAP 1431/1 / ULC 316 / JS1) TaxID=1183438 RepID=U5QK65_GLOK1|nr:type I polyketide synthase [Gloeobacter kilaueensis]AGY58075.1 beta-ketoacyl synthase [Gloeobacter kilaueensis JS1]